MRVIGTLPNEQEATRIFNIDVLVDCAKAIITQGSFTTPQTYPITTGSSTTLGSTSGWSQNIPSPTCSALSYILEN